MADEEITPYSYGKLKGIRPQIVYQWCTKQECPHHKVNGKIFIVPSEVEDWLDKKTKQAVVKKAAKKEEVVRSATLSDLLENQRPRVVGGPCEVCREDTQHFQEVLWSQDEYFGRYYSNHCSKCRHITYHNLDPNDEARVISFLRDGEVFPIP